MCLTRGNLSKLLLWNIWTTISQDSKFKFQICLLRPQTMHGKSNLRYGKDWTIQKRHRTIEKVRLRSKTVLHMSSHEPNPIQPIRLMRSSAFDPMAHLHDDVTCAKSSGSCSQIRGMFWITMALKDYNSVDNKFDLFYLERLRCSSRLASRE